MKKLQRTLASLFLFALISGCGEEDLKANLPPHTIGSDTSLAPKDGRRIEIHVNNPNLTKEECRAIINAYRKEAGPEGQVGVRKPDKNGKLQPWGVDNMDAKGTFFNDFYFQ